MSAYVRVECSCLCSVCVFCSLLCRIHSLLMLIERIPVSYRWMDQGMSGSFECTVNIRRQFEQKPFLECMSIMFVNSMAKGIMGSMYVVHACAMNALPNTFPLVSS